MATAELQRTAPALPVPAQSRGIDAAQWSTLKNSLYPGARDESILMVLDYCKARQLDPMKKPCHIVPMKVKQGSEYVWRDVVMPGIYEYRTTAMRTGKYLGHSKPEYGEPVAFLDVTAPEWCEMVIYRLGPAHARLEFPVRVYFREAVQTRWDGQGNNRKEVVNDRWSRAPIQMLTKCTEAAGLREAFPDEFGGEMTAEEMEGRTIEIDAEPVEPPKPAQRKSEQAVETKPVETATRTEPKPQATAANIGTIADIIDKGEGKAVIVLNTGFKAATKDGEQIQAAARLRDAKRIVELETTPSSDPAKYAPKLVGILPIPEATQ